MTNAFNPELFLNTTVNDANSTEVLQVPPGEYRAVSSGVGPQSFSAFPIKRGDRAGETFYRLDVEWTIDDPEGKLKEFLGREPKVRQGIPLDISKDGTIDMGKGRNVGLGRLRSALNQNTNGKPWSMSQLGGQVAKIQVKHRLDENTGRTHVDVADVAKAY